MKNRGNLEKNKKHTVTECSQDVSTSKHSKSDTKSMNSEVGDVRTETDPTKAILSESGLDEKHLCDYVINVATGCRHGCKFCYVPSTPALRTRPEMLKEHADVDNAQLEWGEYVLYRDNLPDKLDTHLTRKRTWKQSKFGRGVVGVSFATDCYMDGRAGGITRRVIETLANHERYVRILTRNPILALQDSDIFQDAGEYVTIGSSIPCLDGDQVCSIEPRAPAPERRLRGLEEFNELGVQTFVSMSPTYPTLDRNDLRNLLERIAACEPSVVFHEPINPRGANFEMTIEAARDAGELDLAYHLEQLRDRDQWLEYSIQHFKAVEEIGEDLGIPIHLWPDKQHIKYSDDETAAWLKQWKDHDSPENFGQ